MKRFINLTLLTLILLGLGTHSAFAAQVNIGVQIGPPPPPRVVYVVPRRPAPEYVWVDGYWAADGRNWRWHDGYWTRVPYEGARWVTPRYERGMFFAGYWNGPDRDDHDRGLHRGWDKDHGKGHGRGHWK